MGDGDADNMDENANMNGMETPASTTTDADAERNGLISALVQQGWHAEDLQDKSDEELKTLLNENNTGTDSSPAGTAKMSEKAIAQLKADLRKEIKAEVKKELQADMARLGAQNDQAGRMQLQRFAEEKRATIDSFCERMVRDGKILPANLARVKSRLYRADAINKVVLFSEGGKQTKITELADQMKEIEAGPVVMKFGEKVKTHGGKPVDPGDDHDEEVVKFSELIEEKNQQFGGELFTPKEIKDSIEAFKKVRKANPKVTAESAL
jgi:antitoxin component of RelBE/YafQ-DinJ toxin-antitoxin module